MYVKLGSRAPRTTSCGRMRATSGLTIVSKDADFHQRSFLFGAPPKVIWLRRGNCSTTVIEQILRFHQAAVLAFGDDKAGSFLELP